MKYSFFIGKTPITLEYGELDEIINVDDLTKIDHTNIFGDAVTATASANRCGMLAARVQGMVDEAKLRLRIYENECRSKKRLEASKNGDKFSIEVDGEIAWIKLSEKALESICDSDAEWQRLKIDCIKLEENLANLTSLHWSSQQKCRNLTNLVSNVTPEEFIAELIEGKINGFFLKKHKR